MKTFEIRFAFEFILFVTVLPWVVFNKNYFYIVIILLIGLISIFSLRFFFSSDVTEFNDIARIITPILILFHVTSHVSLNRLIFVSGVIIFVNALVITMYASGYEVSFLSNYVYSVASEFSYGRNSGIFSNIAILGVLASFFLITSYVALLEGHEFKKANKIVILLSSYCLVMSQSKTSILVGLLLVIMISIYYAITSKKKLLPLMVIGSLVSMVALLYKIIAATFYTFYKLLNAESIWNISSLVARFDYWNQYWEMITASFSSLVLGVERGLIGNVGNTFDNDYIWILARFGIFPLVIYLGFLLYKCFQLLNYKKYIIESRISIWLTIYTLFASFLIGIIATPVLLGYLLMFYNKNQTTYKRVV